MIFLRQSTAGQEILLGPFLDSTDGNTAETALTIANTDIKIWKFGATTEVNKNSGGATHIASGRYYAVFDATDSSTLGSMEINVHVAGALAVRRECVVLAANVYDALIAASDALQVHANEITAGLITAAAIATGAIDANAIAADAVTEIQSGLATAAALATVDGIVDAILVDTAEIGAAGAGLTAVPWNAAWDAEVQSEVQDAIEVNHLDHLLAVDYDPAVKPGVATALLNELVESDAGVSRFTANALENAPTGGSAPTAAAIADAVWDEAIADHTGAGSFGEETQAHALTSELSTPPTAAAIADAVWDEATADHQAAGSTGLALTNIPGASPGALEITWTIDDGTNPIDGVDVWISTDVGGTAVVWRGNSDANGIARVGGVKPFLNAGTYYGWLSHSGYTSTIPVTLTVS